MSDGEKDESELTRISRAWLAYQRTEDPEYEWAVGYKEGLAAERDYPAMERLVCQLCRDVDPHDEQAIGMIGVGAVESLVWIDADRALRFLEAEVETNVILRQALASVALTDEPRVRASIDVMLGRYR